MRGSCRFNLRRLGYSATLRFLSNDMGLGKTIEGVAITLDQVYSSRPLNSKPYMLVVPSNPLEKWVIKISQ